MALATLDLSLFHDGNHKKHQEFAVSLRDELARQGFVKIVGHDITSGDIAEAFEWNREFFRLSADDKSSIAHPGGSDPQRGWSAVGKENAASLYRRGYLKSKTTETPKDARVRQIWDCEVAVAKNNQEHFDQGSKADLLYPNRWPDPCVLPGFREFMETWFDKLEKAAGSLMKALEVAYGLPSGSFTSRMTKGSSASEARLLHYPAIDIREMRMGSVSRIWPHFDLGVITLLFQDDVGGLECEDRSSPDTFIPVRSGSPSEMVVNVSETLQRWTNGALPAGLHQVTVPKRFKDLDSGLIPERYSITYFSKADRDASVGPLRQFVPDGSESKYDDMTAIQYHQSRLQSAY